MSTRRGADTRHDRTAPSQVVIIAGQPRTGSNLLCHGLVATGKYFSGRELFNFAQMFQGERPMPRRLALRLKIGRLARAPFTRDKVKRRLQTFRGARLRYLDHVVRNETSDDGTLLMKVFWRHVEHAFLQEGLDLDHWAAPTVWIRLVREDRVRQAVSWERGMQTDHWKSTDTSRDIRPEYRRDDITMRLTAYAKNEAAWDRYYAERGIEPYVVTYESLNDDYDGTMRRLLDHLGHTDVAVPPQQLRKQADELSEEWVRRYLQDTGVGTQR